MNRFSRLTVPLLLTVVSAVAAYGQPDRPLYKDRPECPHSWESYLRNRDRKIVFVVPPGPASGFLISGAITNIPEFHDCQKLVLRDAPTGPLRFGELAAVFARDSLDSAVVKRGRISLAEVLSEGDYPTLGIKPGFNCLFLESGAAKVIARGLNHTGWKCRDFESGPLPGVMVLAMSPTAGSSPTDIPPVARWDWDEANGRPLIGVKCMPNAWCTIGGQAGGPPFSAMAAPGGAGDPSFVRVRGWHDAQYLASHPSVGPLTPSSVYGTAFPSEKLSSLNHVNDFAGQWQPSAYVAMPAALPEYTRKYGYAVAAPPSATSLTRLNLIELCMGRARDCHIPPPDTSKCKAPGNPLHWWARVTSAPATGAPVRFFCVAYRPHGGNFTIPPVVRWRWRADDETLWIRCPLGCCEVDAKF